ncbi:MAG: c-type cytochrome domain-containing protein [Planctomyces sp.]
MIVARLLRSALFLGVIVTGHGTEAAQTDDPAGLAVRAAEILKSRCYGCHGEKFNGSARFNVMDSAGLLEQGYIVRDHLADSKMWQRIESGEMPPEDSGIPLLNDEEKSVIQKWIVAGGPQVAREQRPFRSWGDVIRDIHTDLTNASRDDRPWYRYFTLTHLSNNYAQVTDLDMRLYRAAFCKTINSLSYEPEICLPVSVDPQESVFRVDLRKLGWDPELWKWLVSQYPYGISLQNGDDETLADMDIQIDEMTGTTLCWMRADWFINTATRPTIYDRFLKIPENVSQLEHRINVDFEKNYLANRLARAGFATSGVSVGNRLVERHSALHGYYWKSYDFREKGNSGNLFRLPLGPAFPSNDYPDLAFEHDGGEMIFSLPNGLQAYMLTDAKGNRIDKGPIEVVRDSKETGGTPEVLNGLSCLHCHRHGMIEFRDTVRDGSALSGDARRKLRNIYPAADSMDLMVRKDREQFLRALEQCIGPYLKVGEDAARPVEEFAEPVGAIARFYQRDLTVESAAFELGMGTPTDLQGLIRTNRELIQLGLGPLVNGQSIKRGVWESREAFVSPFQETVRSLGIATPVN